MTADNVQRHRIVPSGKYKGWTVSQVPSQYWNWLTSYGQTSKLYFWYTGTEAPKVKSKKSLKRQQQVGGINPSQGVKTGPVRSSSIFRVITNDDGTTTRIEYPRHGSHT